MKILVVDDREDNLYLLETMLKARSFEVEAAKEGTQALEMARRQPPDLVVSDILMPGMDGFALCGEWKKDPVLSAVPFVFYTATYTDSQDEKLAMELGADRFLLKPIDPEIFIEEIENVLKEFNQQPGSGKVQAKASLVSEAAIMKQYSQVLVRKLEDKLTELEETTEKLQESEKRLNHANRVLRGIRAVNQLIVKEKVRDNLIRSACQELVRHRGFKGCWLALTDRLPERVDIEQCGFDASAVAKIAKLFKSGGKPPCCQNMSKKTVSVINQCKTCNICPISDALDEFGPIAANIESEGYFFGYLVVLVPLDFAEDPEENSVIEEAADDIGFALHGMVVESQKEQARAKEQMMVDKLRKAIHTTILVLAQVVESRDPYTAGHQKRVASLASAIAREMELSPEQVESITMSGLIHDIGKVTIPSEVLSKPGRITELEMQIVREHPLRGKEILSRVESPWPPADIVSQHHERIDGSGYPQGMKGEEIIIEARVVAVADVVEAMASHRPYRPALGIDEALKEIEKNKGILYDEAAVEACLTLFREKGYSLPAADTWEAQ